MARNATKGKGKASAAGATAAATASASSKLKPAAAPPPYQLVPAELQPFLANLDKKFVYITHLDTHPRAFKMRIFMVPVAMNLLIAAGLFWRVQHMAPYYSGLLMTMWGLSKEYYIDIPNTGWNLVLDEIVRRTLTLVFDVMLFSIMGGWPYDFLLARPASAVQWRHNVGFQDTEIGVRRSRRWHEALKPGWLRDEDPEGPVYRQRIMPAVDRAWEVAKTSYMMMDKSWDLDFGAMIVAHKLVATGKLTNDAFRKQVIAYDHGGELGWLVWPVWQLDTASPREEQGRQKILAMRERLRAMGKEDLFFRWIELVQFESSQPGGFTTERQENAVREARKLFEAEGVSFDQFWDDIGGAGGMPGLEESS